MGLRVPNQLLTIVLPLIQEAAEGSLERARSLDVASDAKILHIHRLRQTNVAAPSERERERARERERVSE